jgi:hypothetical protein
MKAYVYTLLAALRIPISYRVGEADWRLWTPSSLANPRYASSFVRWKVGAP